MQQIRIIFLFIGMLIMTTNLCHAQTISIGGTAGFNVQTITGKNANGDKLNNKLVPRYALGIVVPISLAPSFCIQPGALYITKGADSENGNTKTNLSYLEIPLNLIYKPSFGGGNLLLGFGPYLSFGIGGKSKTTISEVVIDRDIEYQKSVSELDFLNPSKVFFAPTDAGVNLLAGYEFANGFSFQFNAQLGLSEINPSVTGISTDKTSLKNTGFGVSIGYTIKR